MNVAACSFGLLIAIYLRPDDITSIKGEVSIEEKLRHISDHQLFTRKLTKDEPEEDNDENLNRGNHLGYTFKRRYSGEDEIRPLETTKLKSLRSGLAVENSHPSESKLENGHSQVAKKENEFTSPVSFIEQSAETLSTSPLKSNYNVNRK